MSSDGNREGMNLRFNFTPPAEDEYEDDVSSSGHELHARQVASPSPGGASPSGWLLFREPPSNESYHFLTPFKVIGILM